MSKTEQKISFLNRISNLLLINGRFLDNPGLLSGEMGLVLFFFHYANFTRNHIYSEYGFELIEKIQDRISQKTSVDYKNGLAGIGVAIEYLSQNGYIEADSDEILEDFDERLLSIIVLPYFSIEEILGSGYYAIWRLSGNSSKKESIQQSLSQIVSYIEERRGKSIIPDWLNFGYKKKAEHFVVNNYSQIIESLNDGDLFKNNIIDFGIEKGLAGLGLALLTELENDDSWFNLFPDDLIQLKQ